MKKLFSFISGFALAAILGSTVSAQTTSATVEKLWSKTTTELGATVNDTRQGIGRDGVVYLLNKANQSLVAVSAEGQDTLCVGPLDVAEGVTASLDGTACTLDDAGNFVIEGTFPNIPSHLVVRKADGSIVKDYAIKGLARTDYITATGDVFSAEGGHVFLYGNNANLLIYKVAEGVLVGDPIEVVGVTNGNNNNVISGDDKTQIIHHRTSQAGWMQVENGSESLIEGMEGFKNTTMGGDIITLAGKEFYIYPTGTTNYNSEFCVRNMTDGVFVVDKADGSTTSFTPNSTEAVSSTIAACWLSASKIDDNNAYIHVFNSQGVAVYKLSVSTPVDTPSDSYVIKYTSSHGNIVTPYASDVFGANIVSNTYSNGQGVITFDGPVTYIGPDAFFYCSSLTSITIPNSVISVENAFRCCSSLTSITIPNSVTRIGSSAFEDCSSLTSITIPNSVTSIGSSAFRRCSSLTSITIPNSVTTIRYRAFEDCSSLTSITIPNSVTSIGEYAFSYCSSLTKTNYTGDVASWCNIKFDGSDANPMHYSHNFYINDVEIKDLVIPNSVDSIHNYAFYECSSLTSITIPNSVTSIGDLAFYGCTKLGSVYVKCLTPPTIAANAFYKTSPICYIPCGTLSAYKTSNWSSQVSKFIEECEEECEENTITYTTSDGNTVTPNASDVFGANIVSNTYSNGQGVITFDGPVTSIGPDAFYNCSVLTSITIPNSVTRIGEYAFYKCSSLTSITIPNSVTSIGARAFGDCKSLTSVTIPNSVTGVGGAIFYNCSSLKNIVLSENITSLPTSWSYTYLRVGIGFFEGCSSLTSVIIPKNIKAIGYRAFYGCKNLVSLQVEDGNTTYDSRDNCNAIIETATNSLVVGCSNTTFPQSVTHIADLAFAGNYSLSEITIPNTITSMGGGVFYNCTSLQKVVLSENITSLSECTIVEKLIYPSYSRSYNYDFGFFENCSSLDSIIIPNNVIDIGDLAFAGCSSLTNIIIPNSVTNIGGGVFYNCKSLKNIILSNSISSIKDAFDNNKEGGSSARYSRGFFENCRSLTSISIPQGVSHISSKTFEYCTSLKKTYYEGDIAGWCNINFPSLSANPISQTHNLFIAEKEIGKDLIIPESVRHVGNYAFFGLDSIKFIYCQPFTPPTISDSTFSNYDALLFVPVHSLSDYDTHSIWGKFKKIFTGYGFEQDGLYYQAIDEEILSASFLSEKDFNKFTPISIIGSQNWHYDSKYGATMNGYQNNVTHQNEDWLISPALDLSKYSSATLEFSHAFGPAASVPSTADQKAQYTCWVSNDFNGDVATATWTELPITYGTSAWSYITTTVDIPAENLRENCHIAWKYVCTTSSATWEIKSLTVTGFLQGKVQVISGLNKYSGDIVIPTTATKNDVTYDVVAIGSGAFKDCSSLTSITIPNSVTSIKDEAFWGCSSLNSVSISNSVTSIGYRAFRGCSSLTSITIPRSVTSIGDAAFGECSSLTSIIIPYGVTSIGKNTFWDCSSLSCVTIPNSVTNIGQWAFENCTSLNEITLPLSIKSIDEEAFAGCTKLYDIYCFAMEPPTAYESSFANYNAFLHVPCDNQRVYLLDVIFGNFKYIECIEAETTPTDTVVVTPSFNDAEFIWPSNSSADSYTLAISKDGEIFCTLTFNANGQLTGIAFAPSRNGQHNAPAAAQTANGFAFTVTGLDEGANYTYELLIQDRSGNTLQSYSGEFRTQSTNDRTVTVEYDAAQGQVTGAGTYLVGDTVTLTAIPNDGYRFVRWSNEVVDNPYTFVITENITLSAEFEKVIATSIEHTHSQSPMTDCQKIIHNGQLLILRDGKIYTVMGQEL